MHIRRFLCAVAFLLTPLSGLQALGLSTGYQYAIDEEYFSAYLMIFDMAGPVGIYGNFYGFGATRYPDYPEPRPGDERMFTMDRDYWMAQSAGLTLRLYDGIYLYTGYCNGRYVSVHESTRFDPTYTLSYDGFYTTQERSYKRKPGIDAGLSIIPLSFLGMQVGYNTSLNAVVIGLNTSLHF
ncbi:MAG: hypothetical protein U5N56_03955 [Candidatus Marinimicrobia bacterium]|nr:hypothetical protein [Candidatus Neomarinimicrobiota bacterium]